jgi:predicted outer membrane repeat protein
MTTKKTYTNRNVGRAAANTDCCGSFPAPIVPEGGSPMMMRLNKTLTIVFTALVLMAAFVPAHATVIYVDSLATGADNGDSWANAFTDLQAGLTAADAAAKPCSILVATGTYYPTSGTDRFVSFHLLNDVAIYGGFSDIDTTFGQRDWVTNVTILSGDIGTRDIDTDNSLHVVTGSSTDATAVIDGFTITGGKANYQTALWATGGGMFVDSGSPTIVNAIFTGNTAVSNGGGGMFNGYGSNPTLTNVTFVGNSTNNRGGGMYNYSNSNPALINVVFWNNTAGHGGGVFNDGSSTALSMTNVTFAMNTANAGYGGAVYNYNSSSTMVNVVAWDNSAYAGGAQLFKYGTGSTSVSYSLVQGGLPSGYVDGGGNIDENPLFMNVPGGNLRMHPTSPAANSGDNAAILGVVTTDLDGNPRIAGVAVDMGAYEYPCPLGSVVYVDKDATTGENTGEDWDNAFLKLSEALEWAVCDGVTEIWVAEGTYYPSSGNDRTATFQLVNSVAVYGGFAGGEVSVSQRDWASNLTILSGDIGTVGNPDDNAYHVVTGSGTDPSAVLDGFTITGSYADGVDYPTSRGGGMENVGGSPTLVNIIFTGNYAVWGAGMHNVSGGNPTLTGVVFLDNTADHGGGMRNDDACSPTLTNVMFSGNSAQYGGGMHNDYSSNPTLTNVVFWENSATVDGGGIHNGNSSDPTLINVTFWGNSSDYGGGMYNWNNCNPTLTNTILWGNTAATDGNEIFNSASTCTLTYSLIEDSLTTGCEDGGNNIFGDPLFVDAPSGDLRLIPLSPAVDAGDSTAIPGDVTTDLNGDDRIVGAEVDMGAYESQAQCPPGTVMYVDSDATGASDGTSWADAFTELRYALDWSIFCPTVTEVWVAEGTYKPTANTSRNATFQLKGGLALYGGFAGTETSRSERDWTTNVTILSGDIGVQSDGTDNCYHVVTCGGADMSEVLDGFTITGGTADAPVTLLSSTPSERVDPADVKPTVSGDPVAGSRSSAAFVDTHGGGIYNDGGSPLLANLVLTGNYASDGGGMYNDGGSPTLFNVRFLGNSALWGGAIHNYDGSSPTLINVIFWANSADFGGALYNNWSDPILVNVSGSSNDAFRGGAMYNNFSDPELVNTILWGNSAQSGGHEIHNASSTPTISYSLIAGSGGSGGWTTDLGVDGGGNIDADPIFTDVSAGDLHLLPGSPAIDAGNDTAPSLPPTDLDGNSRIANGTVDMGAYESQASPCPPGPVLYVDANATGANDGSSWTNAFTDLETALFHYKCPGISEIWVAAGTYYPSRPAGRSATFQLVDSVAIYGGFAGGETSVSQRDWETNQTIFSGDIGTASDDSDNSYHVVTSSGTDSTAVLDGFTITRGNANGSGDDAYGGGAYNNGGSPTLINVTFSENSAGYGGGLYSAGSSSKPTLTNVGFLENTADNSGGGMYNDSNAMLSHVIFSGNTAVSGGGICSVSYALLTIVNATFNQNAAGSGGGMFAFANIALTDVEFSENSATSSGGGMQLYYAEATLTNVVFWANSAAGSGGGMNYYWSAAALTNVTFWGNAASGNGGGIYSYQPTNLGLNNTILWGNSAGFDGNQIYNTTGPVTLSYSLVEGGLPPGCVDGGNNVYADPLFVEASGGDLRLLPGSPAIDAGDNAAVPSGVTTDIAGNPRIVDETVDMGAYESQGPPPCPPETALYVDADAVGANDGTSWSDAFTELRHALTWAPFCPSVTEIWVAAGTYHPTSGSDRGATFRLADGVAIYGGFAGTETSLSERDWAANVTILSGDIGDPDIDTDNSYHVVTGSGIDSTAVLDGFTITKGFADGAEDSYGGGMSYSDASPTLTNLVLSDNYAYNGGGGMSNGNSHPTLTNVVFMRNSTTYQWGGGGGMANGDSHPTLVNVTFSNNSAGNGHGGAISNYQSHPTLVNTILWGNYAGQPEYEHEIWNNTSTCSLYCSLIQDSLSSGCTDGGNNIYEDPLFVDAPGGDLRLRPGSPAIDAGDNSAPNLPLTDLAGNPRTANGTVDMGAYEFQGDVNLSASPSPLVFAQVPGNQTTCDTLHVINIGGATCTITAIHGCDTAPFSMDTTMTTHSLAPGDTAHMLVCVNPTLAGPDTAEVTIISDALNSPTIVQVRIDAVTAVGPDRTPKPFRIVSVSPNPFNPTTAVHFTLPEAMPVTAVIWSVRGERVRLLARDERFEPGDNKLVWNGRTDQGTSAASGVYFIRIETRLGAKVARAVLLK